MAAAPAVAGPAERISKCLQAYGVKTNESNVGKGCCEFLSVLEFRAIARAHRLAGIDQDANRNSGLHLEHLQQELLEAKISAPVDSAEVIAVMEVAVIQEFLPWAREA